MIQVPRGPKYRQNRDACKGSTYPCVVCGKPCRKPKWMVHLHEGGAALVLETDVGLDPAGDMGLYPLGGDCLKRHPELKPYVRTA